MPYRGGCLSGRCSRFPLRVRAAISPYRAVACSARKQHDGAPSHIQNLWLAESPHLWTLDVRDQSSFRRDDQDDERRRQSNSQQWSGRQLQYAASLALLPLASLNAAIGDLAAADKRASQEASSTAAPSPFRTFEAQVQQLPQRFWTEEREHMRDDLTEAFAAFKKQAISFGRAAKSTLFFKPVAPPIGSARLSYSRFLHLVENRMIKRVTLLGDGKIALVEIPIYMGGHDYSTQKYNKADLAALYAREFPEWKQEKIRYYVELPGDFWYSSSLHKQLRKSLPHRTGDGYTHFDWVTKCSQYVLEVKVLPPGDGAQWAAAYSGNMLVVLGLVILRTFVSAIEWFLSQIGRLKGKKRSGKAQLFEEMSQSIATAYNVGGKSSGTGVKFDDVQGIDHIKSDVQEILAMLLGSEAYANMGARVPRGVLLEGPPGTGKTFLAKAMANEAGLPFYSANGAEFVQMFQGVAAARVHSLFKEARENAPSIVFIDEIDALGKARSPGGFRDVGTRERELGLMQLLVQMDGFKPSDRVLVIGATNRRDVLDAALLRPGRFDRTIHMGTPTPENRYRILDVHARGKQIPRGDDDALLRAVADKAIGYSGAALANMLNEAAILQVRYAKAEVDMEIMQEVMDKARVGLPSAPVPLSAAKRHLATVWAGRALISAATGPAGLVEQVSLRTVGTALGRVLYRKTSNKPWATARAEQGDFAFCVALMVPMYAARVTEEVLLGRERVTLSTAAEVGRAGLLAQWLCLDSRINPALFGLKVDIDIYAPLSQYMPRSMLEDLSVRIQTLAYHRALLLAHERRAAIIKVADELLSNRDATVLGERLYELLAEAPEDVPAAVKENLPFKHLLPDEANPELYVEEKQLTRAIGLIKGDIDPGIFFGKETLERVSEVYGDQPAEWLKRRQSLGAFATDESAPFPSKPELNESTVNA